MGIYFQTQKAKVLRKADPAKADPTSETLEIEQPNHVWQSLALAPAAVQAKLTVSRPDDPDEQEADQIAERIMEMATPQAISVARPGPRDARDHNEKTLGAGGLKTNSQYALRDPLITKAPPPPGGRPLDSATRKFFEPRFGRDFSDVRVHADREAAHQAEALRANAFTVGSNVVFNTERFQPNLSSGRRLLAHELAHVVQQSGQRATASTPLIQRDRFRRVAARAPQTPAQIRAMTLSQFDELAGAQLDWATSPHLNVPAAAADLAAFRQILDFYREPDIDSTCGEMLVTDVIAQGVPAAFPALRTYTRGASSNRDTAWLRTTNVVATAIGWANDLLRLEAAEGDRGNLRLSMPAPTPIDDPVHSPSAFEMLENEHYIADFENYLNRVHPVLSAEDGWEVVSYVALRRLVDPVSYLGRINLVRNYHHFRHDALEGLVRNEAWPQVFQQIVWSQRPLTLVLHTTMDHNHAFHQTQGMAELILNRNILTIVVEGHPTLAGYQTQIGPVATRYGIDGRIEQVLIAGHGNFNVVGMAGTMVHGVRQQDRILNAAGDPAGSARSRLLLEALVNAMSTNPAQRRIALAACLTASHAVMSPVDPNNPALAATQITNAITANPNIRDFIESIAGVGSTVIGIRASQPAATFLDPTNRVTLNVPQDPHLMGTTVEYIEFGTEPGGVLRALLEGWAADHTPPGGTLARDAANRRIHGPNRGIGWYREIILGIFESVVNHHWNNGEIIRQFGFFADFLSKLYFERNNQAGPLWAGAHGHWGASAFPAADIDGIFNRLAGAGIWGTARDLRLTIYSSWMRHIPVPRGANFLAELATFVNCGQALHYVDMNVVRPALPALLTIPPPPVPDPGQLRIALIAAAQSPLPQPPAPVPGVLPPETQFLRALLGAGPNFPAALNIPTLTTGLSSEAAIIRAIRRAPEGGGHARPEEELPPANVDLDRNGQNDFYLERLTSSGTVANCHALFVRSRPWMGDNIRDAISVGTPVRIVGSHHGWYGIEWQGRIRFVYGAYIQLTP